MGAGLRATYKSLALLFPAVLIAAPGVMASGEQRTLARLPAEFEALPLLRSQQNHLLVNAAINGKRAVMMVDTGSPSTVVRPERCRYYNLSESASAGADLPNQIQVNGSLNQLLVAHELAIGGSALTDVPIAAAQLAGVRRSPESERYERIDGILGLDVLLTTRAVLDFEQQTLVLRRPSHKPAARYPRILFRGFVRTPITVSDGSNPFVSVTINGSSGQLLIDTGAFATLLHRQFVKELRLAVRRTRYRSDMINARGDSIDVAKIRKISIGMVNIVDRQVCVTDLANILGDEASSKPIVGVLGPEILRAHHAILDFGTNALYLKR